MSLCPASFEPLDLPVARDVPGSGAAHGDPGIRSSPPRPGRHPTVRGRLIRTHEARRRPRAPDPDIPQGSSRPRSRRGKSRGRQAGAQPLEAGENRSARPLCPIPSPNGGPAKQGLASADGFMPCPSATTGQRRGTPSLVADAVKPAPFWAELSETTPLSRVPVHMVDESFCPGARGDGARRAQWRRLRRRTMSSSANGGGPADRRVTRGGRGVGHLDASLGDRRARTD
jgi:hypothetical protein